MITLEKGWTQNLTLPDNTNVNKRYMASTINGDVETHANLIFEYIILARTDENQHMPLLNGALLLLCET
jgi:hypothetical protein